MSSCSGDGVDAMSSSRDNLSGEYDEYDDALAEEAL
jgi:hypothetical protein